MGVLPSGAAHIRRFYRSRFHTRCVPSSRTAPSARLVSVPLLPLLLHLFFFLNADHTAHPSLPRLSRPFPRCRGTPSRPSTPLSSSIPSISSSRSSARVPTAASLPLNTADPGRVVQSRRSQTSTPRFVLVRLCFPFAQISHLFAEDPHQEMSAGNQVTLKAHLCK